MGALYFHALAVVVPSLTFETFGMIIIEAFARKTPVIVRNLGALPEVVRESQGGSIYHTDDEMLAAIRALAASPTLRMRLGENGYRRFLQAWTKEAHMDQYIETLRTVAIRKFGRVPWEAPIATAAITIERALPGSGVPLPAAR